VLSLPIYKRSNTFYLHTRIGGKQFKKSLKTSNPEAAKLLALRFLELIYMSKPKLSDFNFGDELKKYEIEMGGVRIKANDEADHSRAMQAIAALKEISRATADSPPSVAVEAGAHSSPSGIVLLELLDRYLQMKPLAVGSVPAVKNAVMQFAHHVGKKKPIQEILKVDVTRFAEKLKASGLALQTVQNRINLLKAVFNFAREYSYLKGENPVSIKVMTKAQKLAVGYEIFDDEDIVSIYRASYFSPEKATDPDYYFVCLIAVLAGIRIGAITNLTTADIKKTDSGVWFLRVRNDKTDNEKRDVPIIPELFEDGFSAFLNTKTGSVFKYMERSGKGKGNAVGKKFNRRLEEVGLKNRKLVFHSLRKYANDFYAKAGVGLEARSQFFGHELDNTNINFYTKPYSLDKLSELVEPAQRRIYAKLNQA
jgi:integrase